MLLPRVLRIPAASRRICRRPGQAQERPLKASSAVRPPQSLVRSSHFTHLMTIQNVRRGDPLAQPYTSEGSSYTPQHVSFPNAFTSVENRATSPHYKAILAAFSHSGANSNRTKPLAVVGSDDSGGQAGIIINATTGTGQNYFSQNGNGSVWNAHSYNFEDDIYIPPPSDSYGNYLYAPTTHGPNGNCLESITEYVNNGQQAGTYFEIADWCRNPGQITYYQIPIDDNFIQNYVEVYTNGDGDPEYQEEVLRDSNNVWHQLLFNNLSQVYQDIYDSVPGINYIGGGPGYSGWTLFETHFSAGTNCPTFSRISASGLRVEIAPGSNNGNGGSGWAYVPSYNWQQPFASTGSPDCFNAATPPYYSFLENAGDLGWYTTDPKPTPPPTPRPTPTKPCRIACP